jgi:hypothetical protein
MEKRCNRCEAEKPLSEFYHCPGGRYGVGGRCKECERADDREFYRNNRERIIKKKVVMNNRRRKERKLEDPTYKVQCNLRRRVLLSLKKFGGKKAIKTFDLIGCSPEELRSYLESKFQSGMTWDNYGYNGWHIDHIIPCASFDLSDPDQQRQCFHYTNLQPLWAADNLAKSDKIL